LIVHLVSSGNAPSPIALDPQTHELTVNGTSGEDDISVRDDSQAGNVLTVLNNVFGRAFTPSDVQKISITTADGNDSVFMRLFATDAAMDIDTGSGNDTISADTSSPEPAVITAGDGNDSVNVADENSPTIHGGDGNDVIQTGAGQQLIYGEGGSDTIHAGAGSDLVSGGGGKDHLFGQQGKDRLYGGAGNDALDGGPGTDRIFGQAGNDKIFAAGDGVADTVDGGDGQDTCTADAGIDVLTDIETVL
jgi:Ca2+-binding RTX toxin-like protein